MDHRHSNVSPPAFATLDAAYRATTYRVCLPQGAIDLRVDVAAPALDRWLEQHSHHCWAFISAVNPGSIPQSAAENARRHAELTAAVAALGLDCTPAFGIPDGADWVPEPSLFIAGLDRPEALALARRFGQNAIVWGKRGTAPALLYSAPVI